MSDFPRAPSLALILIFAASICCPGILAAESEEAPAEAAALHEVVEAEMERLERMQEELKTIESAPLPTPAPAAEETPEPPAPKPVLKHTAADVPPKPVPGAEEQYANMLFALGEYERATPVYRRIADNSQNPEKVGWAFLQLGNCARRSGDHVAALAAYANVLSKAQDTTWAAEASWWTAQVKWRLLWNEESIRKLNVPHVPERTGQTPAGPAETDSLAAK